MQFEDLFFSVESLLPKNADLAFLRIAVRGLEGPIVGDATFDAAAGAVVALRGVVVIFDLLQGTGTRIIDPALYESSYKGISESVQMNADASEV